MGIERKSWGRAGQIWECMAEDRRVMQQWKRSRSPEQVPHARIIPLNIDLSLVLAPLFLFWPKQVFPGDTWVFSKKISLFIPVYEPLQEIPLHLQMRREMTTLSISH